MEEGPPASSSLRLSVQMPRETKQEIRRSIDPSHQTGQGSIVRPLRFGWLAKQKDEDGRCVHVLLTRRMQAAWGCWLPLLVGYLGYTPHARIIHPPSARYRSIDRDRRGCLDAPATTTPEIERSSVLGQARFSRAFFFLRCLLAPPADQRTPRMSEFPLDVVAGRFVLRI